MIVSRPDLSLRQPLLFDRTLRGHGAVRYAVGDFYETLTANVFGGVRHRTDSRAQYCPDVVIGDTIFLECKAARRSVGNLLVYHGRLDKDFDFSRTRLLFYVVWCHNVAGNSYSTVEQLEDALMLETLWCAVIPFDEVWRLCKKHASKTYNTEYGKSSNSKLYDRLYRVRLCDVEPWKLFDWQVDATNTEALNLQMRRPRVPPKRRKVGSATKT